MKKKYYDLIERVKGEIDKRVTHLIELEDYDTAEAIMSEFHEWFDDSQPCDVIGVRVK